MIGRNSLELGPAAYHGLPGKTARMIEPVTEASMAGVLVSYLTAFGAAVGPAPFVLADGARHGARLFVVLVGKTARARKGTSWRVTRNVIASADPEFAAERIFGGFGSGEALIEAVGQVVDDSDDEQPKAELADPRALILEEEFARILRVAERDGSTLSPVIRQAWDDGTLSVLTRKKPVRAKGTHIAVLAHITEDELLARLRGVELANGFGNRFIFFRVERSKRLPDGRGLDKDEVERLGFEWRRMLQRARSCAGPLKRSRDADTLWRDWYLSLDDDRPGMLGALLARAEAQVLRLSLIYALADGETVIDLPHLYAALEVWRYAERSTFAIFGDAVGDPLADLILRELRDRATAGMSRTQIREAVGHHEPRTKIEAALDLLESRHLARRERQATGGRAAEIWSAIFAPEEREESGGNGSSLPSIPSLRGKEGVREASERERSGEPSERPIDLRSQALMPAQVPISTSEGDVHGDHLPDFCQLDSELRRWAAEEPSS